MSIESAIRRSQDDTKRFVSKSYSNLKLAYEVVPIEMLFKKGRITEAEQRFLEIEHKEHHAPVLIRLYSTKKDIITLNQFRDIFDDLGFNVDVTFSEIFSSDVTMVYNIGGFVIPFWRQIVKFLTKIKPHLKQLWLTKLAPGKSRLHIRAFHTSDASWYISSHVDASNWMNIFNPISLIKSHFMKATGNYVLGNLIMIKAFEEFVRKFNRRQRFSVDLNEIYNKLRKKSLKDLKDELKAYVESKKNTWLRL